VGAQCLRGFVVSAKLRNALLYGLVVFPGKVAVSADFSRSRSERCKAPRLERPRPLGLISRGPGDAAAPPRALQAARVDGRPIRREGRLTFRELVTERSPVSCQEQWGDAHIPFCLDPAVLTWQAHQTDVWAVVSHRQTLPK